ncbi:MAG: glucoamylase family protein [Saprospiraceae bacterium]
MFRFTPFLFLLIIFLSCAKEEKPLSPFNHTLYLINNQTNYNARGLEILPQIKISFNGPIKMSSATDAIKLYGKNQIIDINIMADNHDSSLLIQPLHPLDYLTTYDLLVDNRLEAQNGQKLENIIQSRFTTKIDSTYKFPVISDQTLLDSVQKRTLRYFWDFGHPISGMIRERNTSGDLVTIGGTGFGIMALMVGIERGFISRQDGLERLLKITDFLLHKADRFHGVFPHWMSGTSGKTIPFSTKDNGGDLVETSFLIAGLLCASEYFDQNETAQIMLRDDIKNIWETVEWNWHTKGNEQVLYWHWSPTFQWEMNHKIQGWNESLITYILAASSPTYAINKEVYDQGWAKNGGMKNGKTFYGFPLPLGFDQGGPLFFSHYSFLGLDPRNLRDNYGNYWEQVVHHSKINHAHCTANPKKFYGYKSDCWGLTASDNPNGYNAHSPTNDHGVISPTAALSSIPYTPEESMAALRYFYYVLGDKVYKDYGFIDAFHLQNVWFGSSFLAIDQGPIIIMIENHRTGKIWNTMMKNKHIQEGLTKLGFTF